MATTKKTTPGTGHLDTLASGLEKTAKNQALVARYEAQKAEGVINPIVLAGLMGVKPQMIYNYLRKGRLTEVQGAVGTNNTQKKTIHIGEANTFAGQYVERKAQKAAKVQAELEGSEA